MATAAEKRAARSAEPEVLMVPIGELRPNPRNPRKHPESQIERLMAALRRDGQTRPLLARKANKMLIAGHGVHTAARRLGWQEIRVRAVGCRSANRRPRDAVR